MSVSKTIQRLAATCAIALLTPAVSHAYSVLTHEAIVDASWNGGIKPLLLTRYPRATPAQLLEARGYAYGGCIIQDMGYYPFGSHLFTNLVHYVRSGDFIETMLRDAGDLDEYAFALGSAAHFFADTSGHSMGINPSVPLRYPKLRSQFGDVVTYAEGKKEHLLVEFSFDVVQVAKGNYAPEDYHDFIGFKVSRPLLERAFKQVYGLEMKDVFLDLDLALGTYRFAVSSLIPRLTRVAWSQKHDEIAALAPGMERQKFVFAFSRQGYEKEFGNKYERPGVGSRFLALVFRIIPKVGPLKSLSFKPPTPKMELLFQQSFATTRERYAEFLTQSRSGAVRLSNRDFDTGRPVVRGEYPLADETYAELLDKHAGNHFAAAPPGLIADVVQFYETPIADDAMSKKERKRWAKTQQQLRDLRTVARNDQ